MKIKSRIAKIICVILLGIYVMSLGGINVHTCSHTGKCYVTFLFEGVSCQSIHHDEDHDCDGDDGCCTNDSHLLLLTGDGDHGDCFSHISAPVFDIAVPVATIVEINVAEAVEIAESIFDSGSPQPDVLSSFCILRV